MVGMEGLRQEWYKEPQQGGVRLLSFEESQKLKQSLLLFSGVKGMVQTDTSLHSSSVEHRATPAPRLCPSRAAAATPQVLSEVSQPGKWWEAAARWRGPSPPLVPDGSKRGQGGLLGGGSVEPWWVTRVVCFLLLCQKLLVKTEVSSLGVGLKRWIYSTVLSFPGN